MSPVDGEEILEHLAERHGYTEWVEEEWTKWWAKLLWSDLPEEARDALIGFLHACERVC